MIGSFQSFLPLAFRPFCSLCCFLFVSQPRVGVTAGADAGAGAGTGAGAGRISAPEDYVPSENPEVFLQVPANKARIQDSMRNIETFPDMHEIVPGVWLGNQTAAGILMTFEVRERRRGALRKKAACLTALRARRISTIICCSQDDGEPFKGDGLIYLSELLLDGGLLQCDPAEKAKAEAQFASFFARATNQAHEGRSCSRRQRLGALQ